MEPPTLNRVVVVQPRNRVVIVERWNQAVAVEPLTFNPTAVQNKGGGDDLAALGK
jgi:hypothetical protein